MSRSFLSSGGSSALQYKEQQRLEQTMTDKSSTRRNQTFNSSFRETQKANQQRDLLNRAAAEKEYARRTDQSDWTLFNNGKNYREYLRTSDELKNPSSLNVCRLISLGSRPGKLATSDNLVQVYPQLKDRKPHGECDVMLIDVLQKRKITTAGTNLKDVLTQHNNNRADNVIMLSQSQNNNQTPSNAT